MHSHFSNRGVNFVSHVVVLWERCVVLPARLPALRVAPRLGPTALVTMPCEQMRSWTDLHLALHDGRSCCVSARKRNMLAHALPHAVRHVLACSMIALSALPLRQLFRVPAGMASEPRRAETFEMTLHDTVRSVSVYVRVDLPPSTAPIPLLIWTPGVFREVEDYDWLRDVVHSADRPIALARIAVPPLRSIETMREPLAEYQQLIPESIAFVANQLQAYAVFDPQSPVYGRLRRDMGPLLGGHSWAAGFVFAAASILEQRVAGFVCFAPCIVRRPYIHHLISHATATVLVVVGTRDAVNPYPESEATFGMVGSSKRALVVVNGANHNQWGHIEDASSSPLFAVSGLSDPCPPRLTSDQQNQVASALVREFVHTVVWRNGSSSLEDDKDLAWAKLVTFLRTGVDRGQWQVATGECNYLSESRLSCTPGIPLLHFDFPCELDARVAAAKWILDKTSAMSSLDACLLFDVFSNNDRQHSLNYAREQMRLATAALADPELRDRLEADYGVRFPQLTSLTACRIRWQ